MVQTKANAAHPGSLHAICGRELAAVGLLKAGICRDLPGSDGRLMILRQEEQTLGRQRRRSMICSSRWTPLSVWVYTVIRYHYTTISSNCQIFCVRCPGLFADQKAVSEPQIIHQDRTGIPNYQRGQMPILASNWLLTSGREPGPSAGVICLLRSDPGADTML
jgi:hypothetical protein